MTSSERRAVILTEARKWIATPYRHQASVRGAGCDCLGLIRGVWRAVYCEEPASVPPYSMDWSEIPDAHGRWAEPLLEGARTAMVETTKDKARPGDALLFRMRRDGPAKHVAILAAGPLMSERSAMIHAYAGRAVAETAIPETWRRRIIGVFAFPGCL